MVVGLVGKVGSRLGTRLAGSSAARAGAAGAGAGAAGATVVDDIPILGGLLDPTEGSGNGGSGISMSLLLGAVFVVILIYELEG